jgi:predicted DCC family thiol-disulfide oxidoreductase YuxK
MTLVTVWHNGDCPLRRRETALMRRLDTRGGIEFVMRSARPAAR